jgi:hypothetical protein
MAFMTASRKAGEHQDEDHDALSEDDRHTDLPRDVRLLEADDREGHHRIQSHARGESERTVGDQAHADAHQRRTQGGRGRGTGERYTGGGQDPRIHEDDVCHRHERRDAGDDLGLEVGPALSNLKKPSMSLP